MRIKNKLRIILHAMGIKSMIPTDDLLQKSLRGMTIHRFNQILNNDSKTELSVLEVDDIKQWLSSVSGKAKEEIELLEVPTQKAQLL